MAELLLRLAGILLIQLQRLVVLATVACIKSNIFSFQFKVKATTEDYGKAARERKRGDYRSTGLRFASCKFGKSCNARI